MGGTPTFAIPHSLLGTRTNPADAEICIAGAPFDIAEISALAGASLVWNYLTLVR